MSLRTTLLVGVLAVGLGGVVLAQEETPTPKPGPEVVKPEKGTVKPEGASEKPTPRPDRSTATLRVQLVISRTQGEKKTGSLPYAFTVTPGGLRVRMRMGVDTPVPVFVQAPGEQQKTPASYQYRNVGTNIDCSARDLGDGRYLLNLTVENSSTVAGSERATDLTIAHAPMFRRFETSIDPVLRDGQTIQTIASTDPVTGEVVKIDVTLNVVR